MRSAVVAMLLAMLGWLEGCQPQPGPAGQGARGGAEYPANGNGALWPFWPSEMRFHPLTRLVRDDQSGHWLVEARIEFRDGDGAIAKAVGELVLQIHSADVPAGALGVVETWNQDLRDLDLNRRQFDQVTRTYLFRLEIDTAKFPEQPLLSAYFLSADGQSMDATFSVRR